MRVFGIDVSRWQGVIDFQKALDARPDLDSVIIKCSQGGSEKVPDYNPYVDPMWGRNILNAAAAYLNIGVYHYLTSCSIQGAIAEAKYVLNVIKPHKDKINLFVALDLEDASGHPKYVLNKPSLNSAIIRAFCDTIAGEGYSPCLYTNKNFLENYIDRSAITDIPIWYARWQVPEKLALADVPDAIGWQYGTEYVPGVGNVDANYFYLADEPANEEETEEEEVRYNTIEEIKKDMPWAVETIKKLVEKGILRGDGTGFDLSKDMIRILVFNDRAGVYD